MKIEKINDNQIRCTLSHQDLVERELKLSELAYGSEKAKALFHDMMQQASFEVGFEAENIPIMIEAIPVSRETLVLIITKVDNPDELDSRFKKVPLDGSGDNKDSIISHFNQLADIFGENGKDLDEELYDDDFDDELDEDEVESVNEEAPKPAVQKSASGLTEQIFAFDSLDIVMQYSRTVIGKYYGKSVLYKDGKTGTFYLVLHRSGHSEDEFAKICNAACEYGRSVHFMYSTISHFSEHFELFIEGNAIEILAAI